MSTKIKEQEELFQVIGKKLSRKIKSYVIGGSAMLYYNAKEVTRDIDIVFNNKADRDEIVKVLDELGFRERSAKFLYHKKGNIPLLLQRGENRIDLFYDKVVDFKFTESMKERADASYEYNNLIVNVTSPEDIIVLKCATERAGDRLDAANLIKLKNIDWDVILEETVVQVQLIGDVIPLSLYDFISELKEDLKVDISQEIIDKIGDVAEKHLKERLKKGSTVKATRY